MTNQGEVEKNELMNAEHNYDSLLKIKVLHDAIEEPFCP